MRRLLLLIAFLVPRLAAANGGPVAWTSATGDGNLVPVSDTPVALVSERLNIVFEEDGAHYWVHAEYVLSNAGRRASVKYGVPLFWYPPDLGEFDGPEDPSERKLAGKKELAYPGGIRIAVAGREVPCSLQDVRRIPDKNGGHVGAWCVAEMDVPRGDRVPLTLEYRGSFRFMDMQFTKSPFTVHEERILFYDLSPAGHWAGKPSRVEVIIDPGLWKPFFRPTHPEGFTEKGSRLELRLIDPDLKAIGTVEGTLDATKVLDHRERAGMKPDSRFQARASSMLARQGAISYAAANALDGNPGTAWCAASGRPPVRQWIEIHAAEIGFLEYCTVQGYVLVPGYARNQHTWSRNNRVRAVRVGGCGGRGDGETEDVDLTDRFDTSAVVLAPNPDDAINEAIKAHGSGPNTGAAPETIRIKNYCIRLTIEGVVGGEDHDTCISEFHPVINCG